MFLGDYYCLNNVIFLLHFNDYKYFAGQYNKVTFNLLSTPKNLTIMKKGICLLLTAALLLFNTTNLWATFDLTINEPATWGATPVQGAIDEATITLKPSGAYIEVGLYMTFSAKGTQYAGSWNPLEVTLNFELPEGAIMYDSWLWVNQDIIQGIIIAEEDARDAYEAIVPDPSAPPVLTDPSLLTKDGNQYQLRVYPMLANASNNDPNRWMLTRRVKLSYLVPATWNKDEILAQLPTQVVATAIDVPAVQVIADANSDFNYPQLYGAGARR